MIQAAHRIEADWGGPTGRAPRIRLHAPPPAPIDRLLRGRTPEAALGLIPLVFNLCAGAQEGAARAALGLPRDPELGRRLAAEALREHAMRCLKDWPEALGQEPNLPALVGVGRLEHRGGEARIEALQAALFVDRDGFRDPLAFAERAKGAAAKALNAVRSWPADWGRDRRAPAPSMDPTLLRRVAADERIAPLLAREGPTLFVRMAARLVDAARMIEVLRGERPALEPERLAPGVGVAEAARGRLVHRARLDAGRVASYAVETPTDAMMGEEGMLTRMVAAAAKAPPALREKIARLAIMVCDPCAPVSLEAPCPEGRCDA